MDSTRNRIVAEALRLFAEQGYAATSVAAIEEAAGLSPRSGALYTHFGSKEQVLGAAVEAAVELAEAGFALAPMFPLGDLRAELVLVAAARDHHRRNARRARLSPGPLQALVG